MRKVFVLGLDGATLDVMLPMVEKGELPAFKEIIANGGYGRLRSVTPPLSPPAWVSFATGKNPGKNGILGFTRMIPNSYKLQLVTGKDNRCKTVWELSSLAGKKVIVVNVPMTYPPKPVNGLLISGLDTPDIKSDFTYPAEVKNEILSLFPTYKINLHLGGYLQNDRKKIIALRMIHESIESRYRVTEYLMEKYPWDLFIVKFNNPDIVQHHFWKYMDRDHPEYDPDSRDTFKQAIFSVYRKLDEITQSLVKKLDKDTTLLVMSDHGAGARINKLVYINEWLRKNGYLKVTDDHNSSKYNRRHVLYHNLAMSINIISSFLFRHSSPKIRIFIKNFLPKTFSRVSLHFKFSSWLSAIDWSKTTAFMAEQEFLRINLKDFYPQGIVEGKDYIQIRDEIIQKLNILKDPETEETVFEDILTREKAFGVHKDYSLPDIQLVTKDAKYDITGKFFKKDSPVGNTFVRREKHSGGANGMHRPDGIFFMLSPFCRSGIELKDLKLTDLCPTILFLLGIPIPTDIDGNVITEVFQEDFLKTHPFHYKKYEEDTESGKDSKSIYSADDASKIMDNLKSLGYLE
jgi:predicted AlkP superfamily phosphohydrolase/phosphomutase